MQAEYALDVVFARAEDLRPLYEEIEREVLGHVHFRDTVVSRNWAGNR